MRCIFRLVDTKTKERYCVRGPAVAGAMVGSSPNTVTKKPESGEPSELLLHSLEHGRYSFVPPRRALTLAQPRHPPVRDAAIAANIGMTPGTEKLPTSLCTPGTTSNAGYWASKARQEDPFLQRVLAAKNLQLKQPRFRNAYLYQYGVLPDQYFPPRDDIEMCLHPCDKADAKLPQSLLQTEAAKQFGKRQRLSEQSAVSAWDGTLKNVTAPLLWRAREPIF